jgi:conflict system pore-forming effector with SLATT domain
MAQPDRQHGIAPSVVSSIEAAMAARRAPSGTGVAMDARAVEQLLAAMRTVKAARFNAADRLERKNMVSLFAMSMVSLYFVGLSVWQAVYGSTLDEATNRLVTLVSIMSSIFTLVLALIEAMNDYRVKAHHMHACALAVNDLFHELQLLRPVDTGQVQEFRLRYNAAVRSCPYNHARVDYLMARAERNVPWDERAWARLRYMLDVYGLYGVCLAAPPLVLVLFR